eukprot:TRINITY_DN1534_c0_g1_i1.p1 TRINITY_DN1534_c0_g1~~TRINITY_DN1534_c0_g1_i1.p1  ORF type:complete len:210 (+),score=47.69 TRINITY_DN1534_c0_g1_i1:62-631(+)
MKVKPSVLGGIVFLCNLALCSAGDDDICFDKGRNRWVRSRDCEHHCCVDNECGSSGECTTALVIGLIVGGVILCLCVGGCIALWYFCWREGSRNNNSIQPQTVAVVAVQPVQHPGSAQYPVQYPPPLSTVDGQAYPPPGVQVYPAVAPVYPQMQGQYPPVVEGQAYPQAQPQCPPPPLAQGQAQCVPSS